MKHTNVYKAGLMFLLVMILAACQGAGTETGEETTESGPIRIGISLPLTGNFSDSGLAAKQGYETWAAFVNESGGMLDRQVELLILDNGSDQDQGVADYRKLITEDKVDLVFGTFSSFLVIPTSAEVAKHGYAYVEPAGGAPDVFNRGLTNLFFAQPSDASGQADPFALYVLSLPEDQRPQTFAVVSQDDPYPIGATGRLKELLLTGGLELVLDEVYPPDTTDFSEVAGQLASSNPDLIVGGTFVNDTIGQIKAYQTAGYQPRYAFFINGPSVPVPFREGLGDKTEGIYSSISWFPEANEHQNNEFVSKYVEIFGGSLGDIAEDAANAFTVGQVVQQAVESIGSVDNAALIEELHRGRYDTVVGDLSFDETGAPQGAYMLLQWQGDNFVIVGPAERAEADPLPAPKPEW